MSFSYDYVKYEKMFTGSGPLSYHDISQRTIVMNFTTASKINVIFGNYKQEMVRRKVKEPLQV